MQNSIAHDYFMLVNAFSNVNKYKIIEKCYQYISEQDIQLR